MKVREKMQELTKNVKSQVDLDQIVSRVGGLGKLYQSEFPGADAGEFMYEWENAKLRIRKMA